jgi:hypothetical protein
MRVTLILAFVAAVVGSGRTVHAQGHTQPGDDLLNPYRPVENHFKLAEGRWWGSTSAVDIDIDGRSVWVAERCAANSCAGSKLNPVLKFDASGRLRKRFGEGMFIFPNGIHVDRQGSVWVTDGKGPDGKDPDRDGKGHTVYKFSPTGRLLLTLGTPGVAGDGTGALLNGPSGVVTAPNGDIFVADGAGGQEVDAPPSTIARIVKYAKDGMFITAWGTVGSGPGELRAPHGLALDARGRLFVADRGNARIQIFDQEGRFLDAWTQFGPARGISIDRYDLLYAAVPGSSDPTSDWGQGIWVGSARDGTVMSFIPNAGASPSGIGGVAGVAVDRQGHIYGASVDPEIPPRALMKYVRRLPL